MLCSICMTNCKICYLGHTMLNIKYDFEFFKKYNYKIPDNMPSVWKCEKC
jgi:hypothetical protein